MKVCVIGAGGWGKNHINTLNKLGALSGIVDSNRTLLNSYKDINEECILYNTLDDAINQDFDGFIIATPAETHFEIAKKLIKNSHNILIEKPICLKYEEAKKIENLAIEKDCFVMGGHLLLFHPAYIKIKKLLTDNHIGDIKYIYSNRINFGKIRFNENVLWSLAPHDISLFLHFADSEIVNVSSSSSFIIGSQISDSSTFGLKFSNGIDSHSFVSWYHPFKEHRFVVIGENGMISYEDSSNEKNIELHKKFISKDGELIDKGTDFIDYEDGSALENQLSFFLESIKNKSNHNYSNLKLSVKIIETLEKLEK